MRIGFADPEAIANQGLVRFFLDPDRRTYLWLEDDRVVVPKIDDFACGVFTEEIALVRVSGLPRFLNVVGDGARRYLCIRKSIDRTTMLFRGCRFFIRLGAAITHD